MRGRTLGRSCCGRDAVRSLVLAGARRGGLGGPVQRRRPAWVAAAGRPADGRRAFDPPATPYGPGHRGADLPGRPGQPCSWRPGPAGSPTPGCWPGAASSSWSTQAALRTTYEPVAAVVRVGQQVTAGQVIGTLEAGHPGCLPACLHWGLLRGDVYLDPLRLVRPDGPPAAAPRPPPARAGGAAGAGPPARPTRRPRRAPRPRR